MGDRRMAEIRTKDGSLYVYSHYGSTMDEDAEDAIKAAEPRWDDVPYATRIIVDQLTKKLGNTTEIDYGLMVGPDAEDEYNSGQPSIVIDLHEQTLTIVDNHRPENNTHRTFLEVIA